MSPSAIRSSSSILRSFASACALLAFFTLAACTRLTPTVTQVSGRDVEIVEAGAGDTTVVFEAGLGDDWARWDTVANEVAGRARVFAYSRPGYGDSDPSDSPRCAARIVEDLRTLLASRGFAPPYLLVGHSFGGTYMELFAKAHPEEVSGLVLVDSRHRDFADECQRAGFDACGIPDSALGSLPQVERDEVLAFASASAEIRGAGPFGRYPVRVLTATTHPWSKEIETLWESMHRSLAREAAQGEQILFNGAGHYLQLERAPEVAEVILNLIPPSKP